MNESGVREQQVAVFEDTMELLQLVSQVFRSVLEADGYKEHFAKIVFAIIGTSNRSNENLTVFKRTFS